MKEAFDGRIYILCWTLEATWLFTPRGLSGIYESGISDEVILQFYEMRLTSGLTSGFEKKLFIHSILEKYD